MAITKDTTAIVAAQLTVAWSNIYATKQGVGGLPEAELSGRVAQVYDQFRKAVAEVDISPPGYDIRKLIG